MDFIDGTTKLRNLRNSVAHGRHSPTAGEAVAYVETAAELARIVEEVVGTRGSGPRFEQAGYESIDGLLTDMAPDTKLTRVDIVGVDAVASREDGVPLFAVEFKLRIAPNTLDRLIRVSDVLACPLLVVTTTSAAHPDVLERAANSANLRVVSWASPSDTEQLRQAISPLIHVADK